MIRPLLLLVGVSLAAAPAAAANYSATLAKPVAGRFIARDIVWNCGPNACQGTTDESRPLVLCESLAKRAGEVESFLVDGSALVSTDLQRCNASAKARPSQSVASN